MNKKGFTLMEMLMVIVIIGILTSVALPKYIRAVERARATEAMGAIKALNDAAYAYFTEKENCNYTLGKLAVSLPSGEATSGCASGEAVVCCTPSNTVACTKNFKFELKASSVRIPGTSCNGVKATRINTDGKGYSYTIWNPYTRGTTGKALALQCEGTGEKNIALCESLGLYREPESTEEPEEEPEE